MQPESKADMYNPLYFLRLNIWGMAMKGIMMTGLEEFKKQKNFLICVDSDGCAMDTMDIKHFKCFGPCMIEEWKLEQWQDSILKRWNEVNLYTMTRGINRFLGLAMVLGEIDEKYCRIEGIQEFTKWAEGALELSNREVKKMAKNAQSNIFDKALKWSNSVNERINQLKDSDKKPFDGVREALEKAHEWADIAVVSSANKEAVIEEWERCRLTENVDVICCQDSGTKAHCISVLKEKGYDNTHILMVGDALGDKKSADENDVYYYPILVKHEKESWEEFADYAIIRFIKEEYEEYGKQKIKEFEDNLSITD